MKAWGYWKCPYCKGIVQGKSRTCPNCSSAIPNEIKYLPPDNYEVKQAIKNGTILIPEGEQFVDEKGIVSELVKENEIRNEPNWVCGFCSYQNFNEKDYCEGCGAPRSSKTYFDQESEEEIKKDKYNRNYGKFNTTPVVSSNKNDNEHIEKYEEYIDDDDDFEDNTSSSSTYITITENFKSEGRLNKIDENDTKKEEQRLKESRTKRANDYANYKRQFDTSKLASLFKPVGIILGILFLIWLFWPVTRSATVESFRWERKIEVEQFRLCEESDWSVPAGGTITSTRQEIHHYDHVLDHYETKTRTVTEQVFDGYDTSYRDTGNGQFEIVQTPKYKTVKKTETYQEPVYKDVQVYRTKYYYNIGRWKHDSYLTTSGSDKNPYWHETNLPSSLPNPKYGDKKQGPKIEDYYVRLKQDDGETYETTFDFVKWNELNIGDHIEYKSFRFSKKPLN